MVADVEAPVASIPAVVTWIKNLMWSVLLRSSLNLRNAWVPSIEILGASAPVVMSVGLMPSTLCDALTATSAWPRKALSVVLLSLRMVPPLSARLLALTPTPSGASLPWATV